MPTTFPRPLTLSEQGRTLGNAALDAVDTGAVHTWRAYYLGEDGDHADDWPVRLFPDGLPGWATLTLVQAIAGNRLCRMQCLRCDATASPLQPEDHHQRCDWRDLDS